MVRTDLALSKGSLGVNSSNIFTFFCFYNFFFCRLLLVGLVLAELPAYFGSGSGFDSVEVVR
jgi:hypothetical protein